MGDHLEAKWAVKVQLPELARDIVIVDLAVFEVRLLRHIRYMHVRNDVDVFAQLSDEVALHDLLVIQIVDEPDVRRVHHADQSRDLVRRVEIIARAVPLGLAVFHQQHQPLLLRLRRQTAQREHHCGKHFLAGLSRCVMQAAGVAVEVFCADGLCDRHDFLHHRAVRVLLVEIQHVRIHAARGDVAGQADDLNAVPVGQCAQRRRFLLRDRPELYRVKSGFLYNAEPFFIAQSRQNRLYDDGWLHTKISFNTKSRF